MDKVVVVEFDGRRKRIKFSSGNENDLECFERAFYASSNEDEDLKRRIIDHTVVFQQHDNELDCQLDIVKGDSIPNKSVVKALFFSKTVSTKNDQQVSPISMELDLPVSDMPLIIAQETVSQLDLGQAGPLEDFRNSQVEVVAIELNARLDRPMSSDRPILETPDRKCSSEESTSVGISTASAEAKLKYPCLLPTFSNQLQSSLNDNLVLVNTNKIVRECANHLQNLIKDPKSCHYQNMARTVVEKFPELADKHTTAKPWTSFCTQLSNSIRNSRRYTKRKLDTRNTVRKNIYSLAAINSEKPSESQNLSNEETTDDPLDQQNMVCEFKKCKEKDNGHTRQLIMKTASARREYIKSATSVKAIFLEYPHLKNPDLFLYDYFQSFKKVEADVEESYNCCVEKLMSIFTSVQPKMSAAYRLDIFSQTQDHLVSKAWKKSRPKGCITICKASTGLEHLETNEQQSLCLVAFTKDDNSGEFLEVSFLAEGEVILRLQEPNDVKVITLLIAGYFLLDSSFPIAHANFLDFLDKQILNGSGPFKQSITYSKFMKQYSTTT